MTKKTMLTRRTTATLRRSSLATKKPTSTCVQLRCMSLVTCLPPLVSNIGGKEGGVGETNQVLILCLGVLVSSVILMFKPNLTIVDPICTFIFSLLVLYTTYHLVRDSLGVLMEGTPGGIEPEAIEESLLQIPGVVAVHDLHVWTLSPGKSSLTAHITIARDADVRYDEILARGQRVVCDQYGVHHSTLQVESEQAGFTSHCRPEICTPVH